MDGNYCSSPVVTALFTDTVPAPFLRQPEEEPAAAEAAGDSEEPEEVSADDEDATNASKEEHDEL